MFLLCYVVVCVSVVFVCVVCVVCEFVCDGFLVSDRVSVSDCVCCVCVCLFCFVLC